MKGLAKQLSARVERIDAALITYYEKNNKKEIRDPETGIVWQKRQGSTTVYDDKKLKALLKEKGVAVSEVYHRRVVEDRDDEAIYKLLKQETLTLEELDAVCAIQNHKPYLLGLEPKGAAKKKSDDETE